MATNRERDELEQYFNAPVTPDNQPNLGFKTQDKLDTFLEGLELMNRHPEVSERIIGRYRAIAETQRPFTLKLQSRRKAIKSIAAITALTAIGGTGVYELLLLI